MAINWNLAGYVSPNIEIAPDQLPLEALVKTSDVLQDRYDKSYENYTKAQEYQRQMLAQANEADKEAAQQIFSQYEEQLKDVANKGDYHNMRWETLNLAQQAANNYGNISERNKLIQAQKEAIAKDPRWQTSREDRLKDFELSLKPIVWDNEKRVVSNLNVSPYSAAPDVNKMEKAVKYGSLMKPEDIGRKEGYLQYVDFNGKPVSNPMEAAFVNHIVNGQVTEKLPAKVIQEAVTNALLQDEDIKAVKARDLAFLEKTGQIKFTGDPVKDKAIEDAYILENVLKPAGAAGELLKVNNRETTRDITQGQGAAYGNGLNTDQPNFIEPTSINVSAAAKDKYNNELHNAWMSSLEGSSHARMTIRNNLELAAKQLKQEGKPEDAKRILNGLEDLNFLWKVGQKDPSVLADLQKTSALDPTGSSLVNVKARTRKYALTPEEQKRLEKINTNINQTHSLEAASWFDTDLSDAFENQKSNSFLNVQFQRPDMGNEEDQRKMTTFSQNLTYKDFNIADKEWLDSKDNKVRIIGWSTEPIPGEGMMYELMDNNNNVYYATSKKTKGRDIAYSVSKNFYRPFKQLNDYAEILPPVAKTNAVTLLKDGNVPYYSNGKGSTSLFKFSPNAEIQPNQDGSYTLTDGKRVETYPSIATLLYNNSKND
jgi:hypothetical protein